MNVPADGKWIWRFNNRSAAERLLIEVNKQKFHATLPHKIDNAIENYKQTTLQLPVEQSTFLEKGTFGVEGWSIQRKIKLENND